MQEKENILRILKEAKIALRDGNSSYMKELSNQTIHTASITQDPDNISVAVVIYALSKMMERKNLHEYKNWPKFFKNFEICINRATSALEKGQSDYFRDQIQCVRKEISALSGSLKRLVQEVFRKAQINKASRIYEHGISMQQTAKILGISIWELAEYSGQTGISDVDLSITLPVKSRVRQAMEMFAK